MVSTEHERQVIRDAMDRLLAGAPIRSDGRLTVKSLATEADVKRWILTHKHTDLQGEFRARVSGQDATPRAVRVLQDEIANMKRERERDRSEMRRTRAEAQVLARIVRVLTLENIQLEDRADGGDPKVRPIR